MVEEEVKTAYPRPECSRGCKNSLTEKCLTQCAVNRDGSGFDPKPVGILELPKWDPVAFAEDLSPMERMVQLAVYMQALVDQAQGVIHERPIDRYRSRRLPPTFPASALQNDHGQTDPVCPVDQETPGDTSVSSGSLGTGQERPS